MHKLHFYIFCVHRRIQLKRNRINAIAGSFGYNCAFAGRCPFVAIGTVKKFRRLGKSNTPLGYHNHFNRKRADLRDRAEIHADLALVPVGNHRFVIDVEARPNDVRAGKFRSGFHTVSQGFVAFIRVGGSIFPFFRENADGGIALIERKIGILRRSEHAARGGCERDGKEGRKKLFHFVFHPSQKVINL